MMNKKLIIMVATIEVIANSKVKMERLLKMVLSENLEIPVTDSLCEHYYQNMIKYLEDGTAIIILAYIDDEIVGFHWGYVTEVFSEKRIHSDFSAVEHNYRGMGIGSMMFEKLDEIAISKGITTIEAFCSASNKVAYQYHLKNGFYVDRYKKSNEGTLR